MIVIYIMKHDESMIYVTHVTVTQSYDTNKNIKDSGINNII